MLYDKVNLNISKEIEEEKELIIEKRRISRRRWRGRKIMFQ